jgi:proteasome lid subunit RPN8/RPN11
VVNIDRVVLPVTLYDRMLATAISRYPRKSFGYVVSDSAPDRPTDFILFQENIRNHTDWRSEFESRGRYFVEHPDAGFVATPDESWRIQKLLHARNLHEVAVFHTHRRHPGSFSGVDYDLHIRRFRSLWHMIISLRNPRLPQLRAFAVSETGVRELVVQIAPDAVIDPAATCWVGTR